MTDLPTTALAWGPLETPIHDDDDHPEGVPPWKDNAYLSFWDPEQDVYGCLHFSTSPNNVEGRRARLSFYAGGPNIEIVEPLDRGTFNSESITFDLAGIATIDHPRIKGEFRFRPLTAHADFSAKALPTLNHKPLQHFQIVMAAEGDVTLDGRRVQHGGFGIRDRTWGYREMSVNMPEFIWVFGKFDTFSVTAFRFKDIDGADRADGFLLDDQARRVVNAIAVERDASGLCASAELTFNDGATMVLRSGGRRAGFWLPMEWPRRGPAMSAYDEFCSFTTDDGLEGFGVVEHGQIRNLF